MYGVPTRVVSLWLFVNHVGISGKCRSALSLLLRKHGIELFIFCLLAVLVFACLNACRVSNSSPGVATVTYLSGAIQWCGSGGVGWGSGGVGWGSACWRFCCLLMLFVNARSQYSNRK